MSLHRFAIRSTWDGRLIPAAEAVDLVLDLSSRREGSIRVAAPYHGDPVPPAPPGRLDGLWEYEVVELFLLGADERYLEIELGPHGHWLGLSLEGRRNVVEDAVRVSWKVRLEAGRWTGEARFSRGWLPAGLHAANAYAMHGVGRGRRYLAWRPGAGGEPDFHRLEGFGSLRDAESAA